MAAAAVVRQLDELTLNAEGNEGALTAFQRHSAALRHLKSIVVPHYGLTRAEVQTLNQTGLAVVHNHEDDYDEEYDDEEYYYDEEYDDLTRPADEPEQKPRDFHAVDEVNDNFDFDHEYRRRDDDDDSSEEDANLS